MFCSSDEKLLNDSQLTNLFLITHITSDYSRFNKKCFYSIVNLSNTLILIILNLIMC
jgi:hypothetical protein